MWRRILTGSIVVVAATAALVVPPASASNPVPGFIPQNADWLTTVNYYRSMAGLAPVSENPTWSAGASNHSCYMLQNGLSHDEVPGRPGYTASGDEAGNSGNIAVTSAFDATARSHVELWMTGPFHAIGVLRPNLTQVGFGKCDNPSTSPWRSAATLDVLRGLTSQPRPATPILFPGNGTTTGLDAFIAESPNPLDFCGWSGSAGLPVIAMMPEGVSSASAAMSGPNGPIETCRLFAGNTSGTAKAILQGDNAVIVVPRNPLAQGTYSVSVSTQARTVNWSFTVDNTADTGISPIPMTAPAGPPSGIEHVTPFRFADSRLETRLRVTPLTAGIPKRIKFAGVAGLPTDVTAIAANITAAYPAWNGWITAYNCSTVAPFTSSLNYRTNETTGNAALFPLNSSGELCLVSSQNTELVIDVTGYTRPSSTSRLLPRNPLRIADSTTGLRVTPFGAGQTQEINVFEAGAEPGATAVSLQVTSLNAASKGWLTIYPCNVDRPFIATINPRPLVARSNQTLVPIPSDGRLCIYSSLITDVQIDLHGSFTSAGSQYTPVAPTRLTDTRDPYRPEMHAGTAGQLAGAGTTLVVDYGGERAIPANATALSLNVAITGATSNGMLTIYPCDQTRPATTAMAFTPGGAVATGIQAKLSADGLLCIFTSAPTHVVVDVAGWWN
jgi:hypothetical protein